MSIFYRGFWIGQQDNIFLARRLSGFHLIAAESEAEVKRLIDMHYLKEQRKDD